MGGALEPMTYSCSMVTVLRVFIKDLFSGNNKWVGQGKRSGRSEGEGEGRGERGKGREGRGGREQEREGEGGKGREGRKGREGTGEGRKGQREGIRDRQG